MCSRGCPTSIPATSSKRVGCLQSILIVTCFNFAKMPRKIKFFNVDEVYFNKFDIFLSSQKQVAIFYEPSFRTSFRPPISQQCGVDSCQNAKKYSCSKTGVPLCSLECYKKNISKRDGTSVVAVT